MLLNGSVFVDALRRLNGGETSAFDDIGLELRLPDDFVTYTRPGQPGNALARVDDIERYFQNVGSSRLTRDPDLLRMLPQIGGVRRDMNALLASRQREKELLGKAHSVMGMLRSRLQESSTASPLAALIIEDVERFTFVARELETSGRDPQTFTDERAHTLIEQLEEIARRIAQRLLALYRAAGNTTAATSGVPPP